MTTAHLEILRYLWAGLRLTDKAVTAPNGKIVRAVRHATLQELLAKQWVEVDPTRAGEYRLTVGGRERALVKERVRDFAESFCG